MAAHCCNFPTPKSAHTKQSSGVSGPVKHSAGIHTVVGYTLSYTQGRVSGVLRAPLPLLAGGPVVAHLSVKPGSCVHPPTQSTFGHISPCRAGGQAATAARMASAGPICKKSENNFDQERSQGLHMACKPLVTARARQLQDADVVGVEDGLRHHKPLVHPWW
eukprot:1835054-Pyramimonas_sp.AAC.1